MNLSHQRRISAQLLKAGESKVWFDPERIPEIKEAITKADIRVLIKDYAIQKKTINAQSKFRARKNREQKRKGRRKGAGSRKGKKKARLPKKEAWKNKIRVQRAFLKLLRDKGILLRIHYRDLYRKVKGGMFRSRRHLKLFLNEKGLIKEKK